MSSKDHRREAKAIGASDNMRVRVVECLVRIPSLKSFDETEISQVSPSSPRIGRVVERDSVSATALLNLPSAFELFVSAFRNSFPGNGDVGSKRHGSTALAWRQKWHFPRGSGVTSNFESPGLVPNQGAFEIDMRNLLRGRKANGSANASTESEERNVELASRRSEIGAKGRDA
jgi:hypothetical protein